MTIILIRMMVPVYLFCVRHKFYNKVYIITNSQFELEFLFLLFFVCFGGCFSYSLANNSDWITMQLKLIFIFMFYVKVVKYIIIFQHVYFI